MVSTNRVINRLQNRRSRIQGMLSLGVSGNTGDPIRTPLSPVRKDFAGRKFQLAAKKMRILNPRKLGRFLDTVSTSLSERIIKSVSSLNELIHFKPVTNRADSTWSPVNIILPSLQPSRQEAPLESGVLRRGSIIQKMNKAPIKSAIPSEPFIGQTKSQPAISKPTSNVQKKGVEPTSRRFSQVQEVTAARSQTSKENPEELPAVPVKPDESKVLPPVLKDSSNNEIIQSQSDLAPEPAAIAKSASANEIVKPTQLKPVASTPAVQPDKQVPNPLSKPPEKQVPTPLSKQPVKQVQTPISDQSVIQESTPISDQPVKEAPTPISDQPDQTVSQIPIPSVKPFPEENSADSSSSSKDIPLAVPIEKELSIPVGEIPPNVFKKALPIKKERRKSSTPVARPTIPTPPVASDRQAVQRQLDESSPPAARSKTTEPLLNRDLPAVQKEKPAREETPSTSSMENPLQQQITYRQKASSAIRTFEPEGIKPKSKPALLQKIEPLLKPKQFRKSSTDQPLLETPALSQIPSQITQEETKPGSLNQKSLPSDFPITLAPQFRGVPAASLPMPLVKQSVVPDTSQRNVQSSSATIQASSVGDQHPGGAHATPKGSGIIQRSIDDLEDSEEINSSSISANTSSSSSDSNKPDDRSSSPNLENLAEDVLPYVKRILAIEAFRSSGKLR